MGMKQLAKWFLNGCLVLTPLAATIYIAYLVFSTIDRLLPVGIPGIGFVLTIALITLVGFLTSNVMGKSVFAWFERLLERVPPVKLLYTSLKDLVGAFVGDQRKFDAPVAVTVVPGTGIKTLGFVTRRSLEGLGSPGHVAVYLPQSYNFAGNVLLVPSGSVEPLDAAPGDLMTFIVSGGVTGLGVGKTDEAMLSGVPSVRR
jgi:uncharacterized membrane protein